MWSLAAVLALAAIVVGGLVGSALRPSAPPPAPVAEAPAMPEPPPAWIEDEPVAAAPPDALPDDHAEEGEEAAAALPVLPPPQGWRRHAVPAPETAGRPMVVIVIDDLGIDRRRSDRIIDLPGPLTAAFMSYARDLPQQTARARAAGHELLLHKPMQPNAALHDPGPNALEVGLPAEELRRRLAWGLDSFEGMIGLNNHMGSRFTADAEGMAVVMEELRARGLVFLDSLTTGRSVGLASAERAGVPALARDIFLDNDPDTAAVRRQLARVEQVARRQGHAIAIGHPYDGTIAALAEWLPTLEDKGLVLVPLSAVFAQRSPTG